MLSAFVSNNGTDWDDYVPFCLMAYWSSIHETTGVTPSTMMFGFEIRLPKDLVFGTPEKQDVEKISKYGVPFIQELEMKLHDIHEFARKKMNASGKVMKKNYDIKVNFRNYSEGDLVWYYYPQRKVGRSSKIMRPWCGPFKVIE